MPDQTSITQGPAADALESEAGIENRSALEAEVDQLKQETLRLRDLLIAKDAELGSALGQLAEAEDRSKALAVIAARVQSRIPGGMRLIGAVMRRLQGRG